MSTDPNPAKAIFLEAVERHTPDEWPAFLDRACAGQPDVRGRVEELLAAHREVGTALHRELAEGPDPDQMATADELPVCERPGAVVGPYRLLQQIGEGGMGTVYMAEQTRPVRRKVALKVIKAGMDSRQIVARFEAERQALALMDHANIARVLDAGATDSGLPYFVMELVHGVPITQYCDDNRLTPRERLELFVPVCQAIQHAHQKGIIHRDVKPSNVMVTLYDGKPVPKVIDFGVAKATEQKLTERTLFTQYGTMVGTLEYMSPEQAEMSALGVDTRSDIFSLGVLLYELLTGSTPLTHKRMKEAAYAEILRMIKEEEPPRPSTRLSDSGDTLASISAQRHMEPGKLTRLVRGELDWIVMKALEKDRSRRYESANALAADVQRYLNDETVLACPPSASYRLRKFVRRRKAALTTIAAAALMALVAAGGIGWALNERGAQHRRDADEIERAVEAGRTLQAQRRWPEGLALARHARNVLDHGEGQDELRPQVEGLVNDLEMVQRLEEIELRKADATVGGKVGYARPSSEYHPAFRDYGIDVLALAEDVVAGEVRKRRIAECLVESLDNWARAEPELTTRARLRRVVQQAEPEGVLARWRRALERRDPAELRTFLAGMEIARLPPPTLAILGETLFESGLRSEAVEWLRAAHAQHPGDFWINQNLATAHARSDPPQWDEALRHYTAALALRPRSAMLYANTGVALDQLGRPDAARAAWRKALDLRPNYAPALSNIGGRLMQDGKHDQAEAALVQAVAHEPDLAIAHHNLASLYGRTNRMQEAFAHFDRAVKLDPSLAIAYSGRGMVWMMANEYDKASADFRLALKHDDKLADAYHGLGAVCEQKKQYADAVKWYDTAVRNDPQSVEAHYRLGVVYQALGRHEATNGSRQHATENFDKAIVKLNDALRLDESYAEAWYSLGNALRDRGLIKAAVTAFGKAAALKAASDDVEYQPHYNLGNVYCRLGDYPKAVAAYRAAITANPGYARAHINLSYALADQGDFTGAEKAAADALARDKKEPDGVLNFAVALDRQGRYAEALAFMQKSLETFEGADEPRARIKNLIGLYEQFARLQKRLPTLLRDEAVPADADLLQLGEVCIATKDYAAAARFFREAFAKEPDVAASLQDGYRFDAARAAACAGSGLDREAALTPAEQTQWRKQALDWLRADLSSWSRNFERGGPMPAPSVIRALQRWRHHAHLAGVRGAAIDKLPPEDRDDWRNLWAEVDALVQRVPVP